MTHPNGHIEFNPHDELRHIITYVSAPDRRLCMIQWLGDRSVEGLRTFDAEDNPTCLQCVAKLR